MNAIENMYGTIDQWNSISSKFLVGSNQLAPIPITNIDYSISENRKDNQGYYGALISAVNAGISKTPLTNEMVLGWKALILEEMLKHSAISQENFDKEINEEKLTAFIETFKTKLANIANHPKKSNIVFMVSEICCEIELTKLFEPIDRRISHLFMCYLLSYLKGPLIVFTKEDQSAYLSSLNNVLKLSIFFSDKIREAILVDGVLLKRVGGKYASEWYKADDSTSKKDLTIEWHELFEDIRNWKEKLAKESSS